MRTAGVPRKELRAAAFLRAMLNLLSPGGSFRPRANARGYNREAGERMARPGRPESKAGCVPPGSRP